MTARRLPDDPARVKVIACATVMEELAPRMPPQMARQVLDFGLHQRPGTLATALQEAIDASLGFEAVLLGYGLCSRAVVGLRATHCRLVIPRVDDCIAIFLGSRGAHQAQARGEPGTYYLTKGWLEVGDSPFDEVDRLAARYGAPKAFRMVRLMLRNYTRLAFIDTGAHDRDRYRERARASRGPVRAALRGDPGVPVARRQAPGRAVGRRARGRGAGRDRAPRSVRARAPAGRAVPGGGVARPGIRGPEIRAPGTCGPAVPDRWLPWRLSGIASRSSRPAATLTSRRGRTCSTRPVRRGSTWRPCAAARGRAAAVASSVTTGRLPPPSVAERRALSRGRARRRRTPCLPDPGDERDHGPRPQGVADHRPAPPGRRPQSRGRRGSGGPRLRDRDDGADAGRRALRRRPRRRGGDDGARPAIPARRSARGRPGQRARPAGGLGAHAAGSG